MVFWISYVYDNIASFYAWLLGGLGLPVICNLTVTKIIFTFKYVCTTIVIK